MVEVPGRVHSRRVVLRIHMFLKPRMSKIRMDKEWISQVAWRTYAVSVWPTVLTADTADQLCKETPSMGERSSMRACAISSKALSQIAEQTWELPSTCRKIPYRKIHVPTMSTDHPLKTGGQRDTMCNEKKRVGLVAHAIR